MKLEQVEKKKANLKKLKRVFCISLVLCLLFAAIMSVTVAAGVSVNVQPNDEAGGLGALEVIFIFAFLSLLPSIILMMTSFTRIIIVLSFLRSAMGTNQSPPNMVLTGLAIVLSLFIMAPVISEISEVAYKPYKDNKITGTQAIEKAQEPLKKFMLEQANENSLKTFVKLSKEEMPIVKDTSNPVELLKLPLTVVAPAFITSELSRAFMMGFLIFLPFMIIDLVVSSILMSMGMIMLPPAMISLPFKILLFVMVDGWNLMMGTLVTSFA